MAGWSTQARVTILIGSDRLVRLGDKNRDGSLDSGLFDQANDAARNKALPYLVRRYGTTATAWTSSTAPPSLIDISDTLVVWYLTKGNPAIAESARQDYDDAIADLIAIREEQMDLYDSDGNIITEGARFENLKASSDLDDYAYNRDFPLNDGSRTVDSDNEAETPW